MPSKREFPDWLDAFVEYASYSEAPLKSLWWAGVGAIGGALQRNVWIDQGLFQIYPNFYIVINGPAGKVKKSTIINLALGRLRAVEGINFAPDSTTWEGLIQMMEELHKTEQTEMTLETTFTKTIPITVAAPEFSVFIDFEDHGKVSALTHLWDCPPTFRKHTKFSGDEWLEKPCINMLAGTTPSWIKASFDQWTREGGFASRCIWLHETNKSKAVPWLDEVLPKDYKTTEERLAVDLTYMTRLNGPFTITPEARLCETIRYNLHHDNMLKDLEVKLGGFQDRKQVHILKTAMAISAGRSDSRVIDLECMTLAIQKVHEAEQDMVRSFAIVDERVDQRCYKEMRRHLESVGTVMYPTFYSKYAGRFSYQEITQAIDVLKNQEDVQVITAASKMGLTIRKD
jgi:hypothetical protein